MRRRFIEFPVFQREVERIDPQDLLISIQSEIMKNPECGDIVQGAGGVRKVRIQDRIHGRGKRGSYRVIYLDFPHLALTYLITVYPKGVKDDLSSTEKKAIKALVAVLKKELES
jgi:hypothetical protein